MESWREEHRLLASSNGVWALEGRDAAQRE